jgi:MoxR-like ATPase
MFESRIDFSQLNERIQSAQDAIGSLIVGQRQMVDLLLVAVLSEGHVLIEGVPGVAKTLTAKLLAQTINAKFSRIQFTPDLMPSDVTGSSVYMASQGIFEFRRGPVYANIILADEINRAPAKTQAGLFEAMQEVQGSLDGESHPLPAPFMVLATENPFEHEGTYPLPDAQKDRFLMKIIAAYPNRDEEKTMVTQVLAGDTGAELSVAAVNTVLDTDTFIALKNCAASLRVDPLVIDYAVRLTASTRENPAAEAGAGPRGSLALIRCARARALLLGRDFALPDDIKALAVPVLAHRLTLSAESELEGLSAKRIIENLLSKIEAPRGITDNAG